MRFDDYLAAVHDDLERVVGLGDEETQAAGRQLVAALDASLRQRFQQLLIDCAVEVSAQLSGSIDVRLTQNGPGLIYVAPDGRAEEDDSPLDARITLRLPETLKARVESAAAGDGVSVNTWLIKTLTQSLSARSTRASRHHLSGYGRA